MVSALSDGLPPFPIARFTVEQYHCMIESGAFTEDSRLELIEGWVVQQMAKGPAHEYAVGRGEDLLRELVPLGLHVRNQAPVTLTRSEPEPDLAIVRGDREEYRQHHPRADDIKLVIEVSDTTLETDRLKGRMYGSAGIAAYWIVNLVDRCVEVHVSPDVTSDSGYAARTVFGPTDAIPLVLDSDRYGEVPVAALLP
jgi:Uma2 family endonuclease